RDHAGLHEHAHRARRLVRRLPPRGTRARHAGLRVLRRRAHRSLPRAGERLPGGTAMTRAPLLLGLTSLLAACSSFDPNALTTVKGPAFGDQGADFRPVSAVIERRCGTLDCHGSLARPMRIFGQYGLRESPSDAGGDYPGGLLPTTVEELTS